MITATMGADTTAGHGVFPAYPITHIIAGLIFIEIFMEIMPDSLTGNVITHLLVLPMCALSARASGLSPSALLLNLDKPSEKFRFGAIIGLLFYVGLTVVILASAFALIYLTAGKAKLIYSFSGFSKGLMVNFINWPAFLVGPLLVFSEEIMFRGWVYPAFRAKIGIRPAIIVSSLLFALMHPGNWGTVMAAFISGIIMATLVEKTKSLLPAIGFHLVNRFWAIILFRS